ncbi:MAG TPA: SpoIIE family protein phosphatase [Thermoanaerobaculia bacterium]|nr:SpoIIE family protein phosphatase [Thermoanaerobaculia bacterium]
MGTGDRGRRDRLGRFQRFEQFVRDYTAGLRKEDVRQLFTREMAQTYAVLARDQDERAEPKRKVVRFFYRIRIVLLGLAFRLSPVRRLLFAVALLAGILAMIDPRFSVSGSHGTVFAWDASGFWSFVSVVSFVCLLAMELVDRVLVRDELEVARGVQRQLLPVGEVAIPGWSVAHGYRTANEVGGDYYDFLPLADGRVALAVGDASGHGMAAGLVMALASAAIHTAAELDPAPLAVARAVHRVVLRTGGARAFMSLFYGVLDPATGELEYVGAGHPFPLLRRRSGELEELGRAPCRSACAPPSSCRPAGCGSNPASCWCSTATGCPRGSAATARRSVSTASGSSADRGATRWRCTGGSSPRSTAGAVPTKASPTT